MVVVDDVDGDGNVEVDATARTYGSATPHRVDRRSLVDDQVVDLHVAVAVNLVDDDYVNVDDLDFAAKQRVREADRFVGDDA